MSPPSPKIHISLKRAAYDRQRAEAEAKRLRDEAETAAVYEDFVKSFDRDDSRSARSPFTFQPGGPHAGAAASKFQRDLPPAPAPAPPAHHHASSRRHFVPPAGPRTGLDSAAVEGAGAGTTPHRGGSGDKKRPFEAAFQQQQHQHQLRDPHSARRREEGRLSYEDYQHDRHHDGVKPAVPLSKVFDASDDDDDDDVGGSGAGAGGDHDRGKNDKDAVTGTAAFAAASRDQALATARPTLKLTQLPPGMSPDAIRALIPDSLRVDNVCIMPPSGPATGAARRSTVAIVTLAQDTPAAEMDAAVSALQNRYLAFGYFLSLHRHLSSAVIAGGGPLAMPGSTSKPFGARPVRDDGGGRNALTMAPLGGGGGAAASAAAAAAAATAFKRHHRFAPPPSHYGSGRGDADPAIDRAGLLHVPVRTPDCLKTIRLICCVIERILQHGPAFEALLMSRPEVQRDERWAWIWDARSPAGVWYRWRLWAAVTGGPRLDAGRYVPLFEGSPAWKSPDRPLLPFEFVTEVDELVSDPEYDSDSDDDVVVGGIKGAAAVAAAAAAEGEQPSFLNPFDKARLTHLLARLPTALSRIRKGDVARLTAFALSHASRGTEEIVDMIVTNITSPYAFTAANTQPQPAQHQHGITAGAVDDPTAASLIGLYVVSDVLSVSSSSGVRHAWRYRQLIENGLRDHATFEVLASMPDKLDWGRMRVDKWRRSVGLVMRLWEGWCAFPPEAHETFARQFSAAKGEPDHEGGKGGAGREESGAGGAGGGWLARRSGWKRVQGTKEKGEQRQQRQQQRKQQQQQQHQNRQQHQHNQGADAVTAADRDVVMGDHDANDVKNDDAKRTKLVDQHSKDGGGDVEGVSMPQDVMEGRRGAAAAGGGEGGTAATGVEPAIGHAEQGAAFTRAEEGAEVDNGETRPAAAVGIGPVGRSERGAAGSRPRKRMRAADMFADDDNQDQADDN